MKSITLSIALLLSFTFADAQVTDSSRQQYSSDAHRVSDFNAAAIRINNKIDSVQLRANSILNPDLTIDNVRRQIYRRLRTDTLQARRKLDSIKGRLLTKVDSLSNASLPTEKLDSVRQITLQSVNRLTVTLDEPRAKLNEAVIELEGKVDIPREGLNLWQGVESSFPPEAQVIIEGKEKILQVQDIPQQQIDKVMSIDQVQTIHNKAGHVNGAVDKAQAYQQAASGIAQGDFSEVEEIQGAIEEKLASLDEVKELQNYTGEMNQYQEMLTKGNDPKAIRALAKQQAIKYAMDHFAEQQQPLKVAVDQVAKLKSRYQEVADIKDLPTRVPNPMKGKPFFQRLVPGVSLQIQKSNAILIDLSPSIAYRLTGRLNVGGGWNERISFEELNQTVSQDRIWGPRLFTDFSLNKGFALKGEVEKMNVHIPAFLGTTDGSRGWVWSVFVGFKKNYSFYKKVRGNVQLLYNLYDDHDNSPYVDRFNVRMGFEFCSKHLD